MASNIDKFRGLLRELFQLDQADLDFGIYRIMNQKRDEVVRFLDKDLLPQVQQAFAKYKSSDKTALQTDLAKLVTTLSDAGMNADDSPKVKALKQQIAESSVDVAGLEGEVYSHLFNFFRRYYEEGDFISLRRYKEGVYAIPYEGEEVKLHWANADQYYVKSSEYLRDYAFTVGGGKRVHFRLTDADTEKDNNKAAAGDERRFALANDDEAVAEVGGELILRFTYKPDEQKRKQTALNDAAEKRIIEAAPGNWSSALSALRSASTLDPKPSVLRHHLTQYTARNTFDYFIHKNLGGFLRRELDFYIKNEVMYLDDVLPTEQDTPDHQQAVLAAAQAKMASRLSVIAIFRDIGQKIVRFLAQIEDFQKKLWLKKKFVVSTDWLVTIDRISPKLREIVAKNARQWAAWEGLGFEPVELPLGSPEWGSRDYLDANDKLVVDTALFNDNSTFLTTLLASDEVLGGKPTLDDAITGVLLHSENFQALSMMQARYGNQIAAVYADPPYNTDAAPINYKNGYKDGSWLSLLADRLAISSQLTASSSITCLTIDDAEVHQLRLMVERSLSLMELLGVVVIKNNPAGRTGTVGLSIMHEYAIFYGDSGDARVGRLEHSAEQKARYKESDELGAFEWTNFRKHGGGNTYRTARPRQFYPIYVRGESIRIPALTWNAAARSYDVLEKPASDEAVLLPIDSQGRERIWDFVVDTARTNLPHLRVKADARGEIGVYRKWRINDEGLLPPTVWDKSKYSAAEYGTNLLARMFGRTHTFSFPKSVHAVEDCLRVCGLGTVDEGWVLDFFGGSGTTGHAVISMNRDDGGNRRFILVEMGDYFHTVLKPRIAKAMYSPEWKDGRATAIGEGVSGLVKVMRLEGYEDTLNNLTLMQTAGQADLLSQHKAMKEEYMLGYLLDTESRGSASLLNVQGFTNPFAYTLNVTTGSATETKPATVDLVETFNWLLGLRVKHIDHVRGVRVVDATNAQGDRVLVLWRNTTEMDSEKLDAWFEKQGYSTLDMEYAAVYVNGDNNLENLRRANQTWKVRLIEEEFQRLMFDVQDA